MLWELPELVLEPLMYMTVCGSLLNCVSDFDVVSSIGLYPDEKLYRILPFDKEMVTLPFNIATSHND